MEDWPQPDGLTFWRDWIHLFFYCERATTYTHIDASSGRITILVLQLSNNGYTFTQYYYSFTLRTDHCNPSYSSFRVWDGTLIEIAEAKTKAVESKLELAGKIVEPIVLC